jgi:hypothetical protein
LGKIWKYYIWKQKVEVDSIRLFQLIADVMEALVNLADVLAELWPLDNTARVLMRIGVHYKFAVNIREGDRCKIITEFCDSVLRENASRAVGRLPPLSFRQAKERWADVAERYGPVTLLTFKHYKKGVVTDNAFH